MYIQKWLFSRLPDKFSNVGTVPGICTYRKCTPIYRIHRKKQTIYTTVYYMNNTNLQFTRSWDKHISQTYCIFTTTFNIDETMNSLLPTFQIPNVDGMMNLHIPNVNVNMDNFSFANMKGAMEQQMPKKILGMGYQQRFQVQI